ncbi:toprim domain-containing protein [Candidatus Woesearchaeota archaeon]|nr:toprim domain-containing protein [Candidatus Woesearchaeota archaeon]
MDRFEPCQAVIVEGKKDKEKLELLGFKNVIALKGPIYQTIEEVASKYGRVMVLTDLDREGRVLYGKIASGLRNLGVNVDDSFRNHLFRNTKVRQIEGISEEAIASFL